MNVKLMSSLWPCQDYLRERLMAEKQMKVFASEEGAASRLPSDLPRELHIL